uniref:Uncharacterized protein n=1 Tax=Cucumis melo TaxID=3656 RepID=A0A9I9CZ92_CUCME
MGNSSRSPVSRVPNDALKLKLIVGAFVGAVVGFCIGVSFPVLSLTKLNLPSNIFPTFGLAYIDGRRSSDRSKGLFLDVRSSVKNNNSNSNQTRTSNETSMIWVPSNPRGAETLPPKIVSSESDLYARRLWGNPSEDLTTKPQYLVAFTVGYNQRYNIDRAVRKFSDNFVILLFHYDGRTSEWDEFEWSKRAIHTLDWIILMQTSEFATLRIDKLVRKYGLEISQPGLQPSKGLTWRMTRRRDGSEVHKMMILAVSFTYFTEPPPEIRTKDQDGALILFCLPVLLLLRSWLQFSRERHGVPAHEKIGVIDAQWIVHQGLPSLGSQGESQNGQAPWVGVSERCRREWTMLQSRWTIAENAYLNDVEDGVIPSHSVMH